MGNCAVQPAELQLRASPVREIYSSDTYHVAAYMDLDTGKNFTAVGASLCSHCSSILHGRWTKSKYGKQFAVSFYEEIRPDGNREIENYLVYANIKHIGRVLARRVVAEYGADTYDAMESVDMLSKIRGISEAKAEEIVKSYKSKAVMQDYFRLLSEFGIPASRVDPVYQKFGRIKDGADILRGRPYLLCMVEGISFETVDSAMKKKDFDPYHPDRVLFGVMEAVFRNETDGNVFIRLPALEDRAMDVLGKTDRQLDYWRMKNAVRWTANQMVREKILVYDLGVVYRKNMYTAESGIAEKLASMIAAETKRSRADAERAEAKAEKKSGLCLSGKQREGVVNALLNNVYIITGGPGKGKTTLLKVLLEAEKILSKDSEVALCAPTGRAARKMAENAGMPASTIHHLLSLMPGQDKSVNDMKEAMRLFDLVVMDESSMCDIMLFYMLIHALSGHTRLILIGDKDQLESVQAGNVFGELTSSGAIPMTVLDKNFRQGDGSRIVSNGDRINYNQTPLEWDSDCRLVKTYTEQDTLDNLLRQVVQVHESGVSFDDIQVLTPFRSNTQLGAASLNTRLQEVFNPEDPAKTQVPFGTRIFREGDRVIHINKNEEEVSNGDMGEVIHINPVQKEVTVQFETGVEKVYDKSELPQLDLAYAMTVHKSQGSEYPYVVMPFVQIFGRMRTRRLLYTAFTRAKKGICIIGNEQTISYAAANPGTIRDTYLAYRVIAMKQEKESEPEQLSLEL
ncbi:MAG: AAA family ATPase [Clostridiales bacterium]|nr:AAA family ATPase [Clostridiales bacterium]